LVYAAAAIDRLRAFARRSRNQGAKPQRQPAVTIMKPVSGIDAELEANLRSFCEQDYPDFEVVFGVHHAGDPALDVIRGVAAETPRRTAVVVGDGVLRCRNPKMANVAPMLAHAHGEIFVISDSDMRVAPDYLDAVTAPFADPRVGAVTALYRGEPADGALASILGAMCLTEQFAPSTLVADLIEPVQYVFGSTMAVRRDVLAAIGGIDVLGDHLADDFALGRLVTEHGYRVAVASCVVVNVVAEPSVAALVEHELRWARTIRAIKPLNYPGIVLTYPLPLAVAHLALARDKRVPLALLAIAVMLRIAVADTAHAAFGSQQRPPRWLIPLRDAIGVVVWARGLWGRRVRWRGQPLRIAARDRLEHGQD
ncbi:MAG TPA: bacteriohopanetetrol glucosamine biosynthesis glycosyltransferase HpnI, partial [Candidatus Elarobacter sp.]